jgi:hypothetical protein
VRSGKQKGYSLVEMVAAAALLVPIFLALIDLYFLIMGYWWTISHCRAAARAAAQGPPNVLAREEPRRRAMEYLNVSGADGSPTLKLIECEVTEQVRSVADPTTGGAVNGTVTVEIQVEVTPPFLLKLGVPGQKFIVNASQTSPYTYVQRAKPEVQDSTNPPSP